MEPAFWPAVISLARSPWLPIIAGTAYLLVYLVLTELFYRANRRKRVTGLLRRNGLLDIGSSVVLAAVTGLLMAHVVFLGVQGHLTFRFLLAYYFLFIVLYAGIFSLLEWHRPGSLRGVHSGTWRSELQCLVISLQTMTTLGYTRSAPNGTVAELVACAEAILGIFFIGVFISRWVNAL